MIVTPPGNPVQTWATTLAAAAVVAAGELAPGRGKRLVVVSAHPDDETLGAGRLIAEWARQIGPVLAVTVTAGEACVAHLGIDLPELGARRIQEWRAAMAALGAHAEACWAVPDGFVGAAADSVAARLEDLCGPDDVVLAPWRHDPHPDHRAAGSAAALAAGRAGARLLEYPVWMTYWDQPPVLVRTSFRLVRVAVAAVSDAARERALAAFESQRRPLRADLGPVVPPAMLAHHRNQLILLPVGGNHD